MQIIDSHLHWWPRPFLERLCRHEGFPRAELNHLGGYNYWRAAGTEPAWYVWAEFFELEKRFDQFDALGHQLGVVNSAGVMSDYFSELAPAEGREAAVAWNEEMAALQRRYAGRFWSSAVVPLADTRTAIDVLNDAIDRLGLVAVSLPGAIGGDPRIDAERLDPFYARVEEKRLPLILHPTDSVFAEIFAGGYEDALHLSLGRIVEISTAAMRLVLSGTMARHPALKVVLSHMGGALPYQAGRMDKNSRGAKLPGLPSEYLKRMYTDTVQPDAAAMKFGIDFFGSRHVMYGTDYPCWDPAAAMKFFDAIELSSAQRRQILAGNAIDVFCLPFAHDMPIEMAGG